MKTIRSIAFCLLGLIITANGQSQVIDTLRLIKTIEVPNYSVFDLDTYFDDNTQLIAYSNSSGSTEGDTLVVFDLKNDSVISWFKGTDWNFDIAFINDSCLLYHNWGIDTIYSVSNFTDPVVTSLIYVPQYDFIGGFTLSDDKSRIAASSVISGKYQVQLYDFNAEENLAELIDTFTFTNIPSETELAISDDNSFIALSGGYGNDTVLLIDVTSSETYKITVTPNQGTYSPSFFKLNGELKLVVGGGYEDGSIEIIDVATHSFESSVPVFLSYNYSVSVDSGQNYMACGGYNSEIRVLKIGDNEFTTVFSDTPGLINKIKFSNDNKFLVAGLGAGTAKLVVYEIVYEEPPVNSLNSNVDEWSIYPVPVVDILYIDGFKSEALTELYTLNGNRIRQQKTSGGKIDLSDLPQGVYLLKVFNSGSILINREIIKL